MRGRSYLQAVSDLFRRRPLVWVDGLEVARVGGAYASRTRISECRVRLGMTIENRQRVRPDGSVISEYRYVPAVPGALPLEENSDGVQAPAGD